MAEAGACVYVGGAVRVGLCACEWVGARGRVCACGFPNGLTGPELKTLRFRIQCANTTSYEFGLFKISKDNYFKGCTVFKVTHLY